MKSSSPLGPDHQLRVGDGVARNQDHSEYVLLAVIPMEHFDGGREMTFEVYFHADHALLWSVRYALSTWPDTSKNTTAYLAAGSACVLSCSAALEAMVNQLLADYTNLRHWDEFHLKSKIDTLADLHGGQVDWGRRPWQDVTKLIRVRNWLAHHKELVVGLSGACGEWVVDSANQAPRIDPQEVLQESSIRGFYGAVREAGVLLSAMVGDEHRGRALEDEEYDPMYAG